MKEILLVLTLVNSVIAHADTGAFACAYQAKLSFPAITNPQIVELCNGAKDDSPANCLYQTLTNSVLKFDLPSAVKLCKPSTCISN